MKKFWIFFFLLCFLGAAWPDSVFAGQSSIVRTGNRQYRKGDYAAALESYQKALEKDPNSDIINFNIGTAMYQQQDYPGAITRLQQALLTEDISLQQKTAYNLGSAFYQQGKTLEQADINGAIDDLERSLSHFQRSIDLDGKDEDAQYNYAFVQRELEQLKQKKEQQQNNSCPLPKKESSSQDKQQKDEQQSQPQDSKEDGQQRGQPQSRDQDQEKEQEGPSASTSSEDQQRSDDQSQNEHRAQSPAQSDSGNHAGEGEQNPSEKLGSMTKKQAEAAIANYQQNEEPRGMFYLLKKPSQDHTVEKDW